MSIGLKKIQKKQKEKADDVSEAAEDQKCKQILNNIQGEIVTQTGGSKTAFVYKDGDSKQDVTITIDNVKRIDENSPWIGMDFPLRHLNLHIANPSP